MGPGFNNIGRPGFANQNEKLLYQDETMLSGLSKLEEPKRAGYSAEGYDPEHEQAQSQRKNSRTRSKQLRPE